MAIDSIEVSPTHSIDTYTAINPLDLPRIDRDVLISTSAEGVYVEPPDEKRVFNRYGAEFVDDPDEVGLFSGKIGPTPYWYPPVFTTAANNVVLVGYRTILTSDKRFYTDEGYVEEDGFQNQLQRISKPGGFQNEETRLYSTGEERVFRFDQGDRAVRQIEGPTVILCSDEPLSYGSFLFRVLPKVRSIRDLGLTDCQCVVYASQEPLMDLLSLGGLPPQSILQHDFTTVTQIERAIVPCLRNPDAYLDPESFELFAEMRASYGRPMSNRRIYVSRLGLNKSGRGASRIMLNEEELIQRLERIGFETIEPESMTVREQIMAFSSASVVVGPSGSGLFNSMFCHPDTKLIDIQSEPQWIHSYTGMYSSLRLQYGIFVGNPDPTDTKPVHRRFTVNIDELIARVREFTSQAEW